jgi:hypothetical protein
MFVKHVKGNVKEGVDTPLGIRTLIVGDNGTGKSSIINAIELALGGFASDVNGRSAVRTTSELITLKNTDKTDKSKLLQSSATLDNGGLCHWEVKKTPKGAGRATHTIPKNLKVRFPFQEVKDNLTGSAATARQYLLSNLDIASYLIEAPENVKSQLSILVQTKPDIPLGDHLQGVVEIAKRRIKDAKAEIKAVGISKDLLGKGLIPTTEEAVENAKADSEKFLQAIMKQGKAVQTQDVEAARQRALMYGQSVEDMDKLLSADEPQAITEDEHSFKHILGTMSEVIKIHHKRGDTSCLVCGGSLENVATSEAIEEILSPIREREQNVIIYNERSAKREVDFNRFQEAVAQYEALKNKLEQTGTDEDIHVKYTQARKVYEDLKDNWSKQKRLSSLDKTFKTQEEVLKKAEQLKINAEETAQAVVQKAIEDFEDKVTAFLPEGRKFVLDLGKSHCRLGMSKYNSVRYAVSGAEYNMLILAIGAATSVDSDAFNVFIPEERAYDQITLMEILDTMKNANGQVIITSTTLPPEPHPSWGLVQTTSIPF